MRSLVYVSIRRERHNEYVPKLLGVLEMPNMTYMEQIKPTVTKDNFFVTTEPVE